MRVIRKLVSSIVNLCNVLLVVLLNLFFLPCTISVLLGSEDNVCAMVVTSVIAKNGNSELHLMHWSQFGLPYT
jgi:hypothetical protein